MKLTKKLLWTPFIIAFFVSMTMINVTSASPATYFWVDPPLIQGTPTGKITIDIRVTDAPSSYAWEIYLSWKPERLELVSVTEGDFLHRWAWDPFEEEWVPAYATSIAYTPWDEANLNGEILITCTLITPLPESEWASGDGWLVSLEFVVQADKDVRLNLFGTRLWDHIEAGYPAPTPYRSNDGYVYPTNFYYVALAGWKFKVTGRSGGKTVVGTGNLLEAYVNNIGTFDTYAQAFFEIRDSAGYWLDTIPSNIELLSAGGSTTLSATWTPDEIGVYYITAYSFYGELAPTIPDGFSRTIRIEVVS